VTHSRRIFVTITGCALTAVSPAGLADTPIGLYIGAGGGQSDVRMHQTLDFTAYDVSRHDSGWKVMVGVRPVRIVGAELEYVDFGSPSYRFGLPPVAGVLHAKAEGLFGLLYAPIPTQFLDIYAKLGLARLLNSVNGTVPGPNGSCRQGVTYCPTFTDIAASRTNVDFGYGAGVQFKFRAVAVRAEYERISANTGDPDLASLGLTWTF
jgi:OmpA-like transmembrane domain